MAATEWQRWEWEPEQTSTTTHPYDHGIGRGQAPQEQTGAARREVTHRYRNAASFLCCHVRKPLTSFNGHRCRTGARLQQGPSGP
eukprot:COSAG04_NODE_870_length_9725_cov_3.580303_5_plen_85_part_00